MARVLAARLRHDLTSTREELVKTMSESPSVDLEWSPAGEMKTYRAILKEIGAMEVESAIFLQTGRVPEWSEAESKVSEGPLPALRESLTEIRRETLSLLDGADDRWLETPVDIPTEWVKFMGDSNIERQEFFRWIVRHEYYHLGQIVTYRWIQGVDPYSRA